MKLQLNHRLSQSDIHELCALTQGERNNSLKEQLYQLTLDADRRVATNALWVFTHFALADNEWLYAKHDQLIDRCLNEKDATKLRLMLNLLLGVGVGICATKGVELLVVVVNDVAADALQQRVFLAHGVLAAAAFGSRLIHHVVDTRFGGHAVVGIEDNARNHRHGKYD